MIKVFFFYFNKNKYYSSTPIINNFKILFNNKKLFLENNIEITPFIDYVPELNKDEIFTNEDKKILDSYFENAMKSILIQLPNIHQNYQKIIFLGFHPKPFTPIQVHFKEIKKYPNTFTILWQDDIQAYFNPEPKLRRFDFIDKIITPSPIYLKQVAPQLLDKTTFFFYSIDFHYIKGCSQKFSKRKNKILLSGCVNQQYRIRHEIAEQIKKNNKFNQIADQLNKPRMKEYNYENENNLPYGINYYKILGSYKGAFFGYYNAPMNFNLAKIIEILSVGCIGFFEESPLLKEELGLIPYTHYVPCTKDGQLITKTKYYKYFLNNEDNMGMTIAENGRKYVEENFSNKNGINNYIKIFNDIGKN